MSESYSIEIPNEKLPTYRVVTLIVSIINLLAFVYLALNATRDYSSASLYVGLGLSVVAVMMILVKRFGKALPDIWAAMVLVACALIWMVAGNILPGFLLMIFAMMSLVAQKQPVIHFEKAHIRYPSFPEKILLWTDVDFVMLKDDILTIEMKDNQLLQFTLQKSVAAPINAENFNCFCAGCVSNSVAATTS